MNEQIRNIPASVHARLAIKAREFKKPFSEILQHYGMERFLYRLSRTRYAENFILKGGLIFTFWNIPLRRPTRDIDFLGSIKNSQETIYEVVKEALSITDPEDGITFDILTVKIEEKQVDADRLGIRVTFIGYLGRAEIPMHIDIGFSDEILSPIRNVHYPTLLDGIENPLLNGYPPEFVVAEKFHAMQKFVERPSRWKDYYDIWLISESFEFDNETLQKAIIMTFTRRSTNIPEAKPQSLSVEFARYYDSEWKRFIGKNDLENKTVIDFTELTELIWEFLSYPLLTAVNNNVVHKKRYWHPNNKEWKP